MLIRAITNVCIKQILTIKVGLRCSEMLRYPLTIRNKALQIFGKTFDKKQSESIQNMEMGAGIYLLTLIVIADEQNRTYSVCT